MLAFPFSGLVPDSHAHGVSDIVTATVGRVSVSHVPTQILFKYVYLLSNARFVACPSLETLSKV